MTSKDNLNPEPTQLDNVSGEPIYLLDRKLLWRNFKKVYDKVSIKDGPTPGNFDRVIWQMNRDGLIYTWLDGANEEDPVGIGLELPKGRPVKVLTNPKRKPETLLNQEAEKEVTQALSTSTSLGSEADTKPSGTLEENIRQTLLETVQFTHTNGNNIEIQPDLATQALLSLYQKELDERVHEEVGRILFKLPLEARKYLEPYLQAALTKLTGDKR